MKLNVNWTRVKKMYVILINCIPISNHKINTTCLKKIKYAIDIGTIVCS